MYDTFIDVSRTLPNGAPNPNFLHRYSEYLQYFTDKMDGFESLRAQGVYGQETRIGKFYTCESCGGTTTERPTPANNADPLISSGFDTLSHHRRWCPQRAE